MVQTRYPDFDVMAAADAWDPHTRAIVERRLVPPGKPKFLTGAEVQALRAIAAHLLYEERDDVLGFVLSHVDEKLNDPVGEAQRKEGAPPLADLIRKGLAGLDAVARWRHGHSFVDCGVEDQFVLLAALQHGALEAVPEFDGIPQKEFFKRLLGLAVEALASHPAVWSEMGYAGPAYPRGYYRIEQGVTDPWEAKADSQAPAP